DCNHVGPRPLGFLTSHVPGYLFTMTPGYRGTLGDDCWSTQVRISSAGTRGEDTPRTSDPAHTILFTGDSYAFGYGVEEKEAVAAQLEQELNGDGAASERYQVLNMGVPGWETKQESLLVEEKAKGFGAGEALLLVYLGNDIEERVNDEESRPRPWRLRENGDEAEGESSAVPTLHLIDFVTDRLRDLSYESGLRRRPLPSPWFEILKVKEPPRVARGLSLMAADIEGLEKFSLANGVDLRVAVAPGWFQVTRPTAEDLCRGFECK